MDLIIIVIILLVVFGGGGGYYGFRRNYYTGNGFGGILGLIVLAIVLLWFFGELHGRL